MTQRRTRVKICGITREEDRTAAVEAGADAVGFVADVPIETPRELSSERARSLVSGVSPLVTSVLVTMPDSVQDAVSLQDRVGADVVQIHGGLSPEHLGGLASRIDAHLVATVDADQNDIDEYAAATDAILVDSSDDHGAGGTGETHDWSLTREHVERLDTPVILAGGLTADNVAEAIEIAGPFAVDTSSGVEHEEGRKDHDAIQAFVDAARTAGEGS